MLFAIFRDTNNIPSMKKTALSIHHGPKGRPRSPISFSFPQPLPGETVSRSTSGDGDENWQCSSLGTSGIGKYLSYRQYRISEPTKFTVEPSEPVACLGILVSLEGAQEGNSPRDGHIGLRWDRLFWSGDRPIEFTLPKGDHYYLDLFVRPDSLAHLVDREPIKELLEVSMSASGEDSEGMSFGVTEDTDSFLAEMLEELNSGKTTAERFGYLCDCLILKYIGEQVEVSPTEVREEEKEQPEKNRADDKRYEPSPPEREILSELEGMDRDGLLGELQILLDETEGLKQTVRRERELDSEVKGIVEAINRFPHEKLGTEYMKAANLLAGWHKKIPTKNRKVLKQAIVSSCESAFALRLPSMEEMDFYVEWSGRPYVSSPMGADMMTDLLSLFLPPDAPKLTPMDGTSRSGNMVMEQIREAFGFKSMSEIKRETAKDKPKEVVELYQRLMEHFCDTLDLGKAGDIKRSDIVRELDAAYQENDLLTLLQIEAENLAGDPDYIDRQADERLLWLIVGLRSDRDNYRVMLEEMEESPAYHDLQRFHRLGDDMEKFRRHLERNLKKMIPVSNEFSSLLADISYHPSVDKVMALAKSILASRMEE